MTQKKLSEKKLRKVEKKIQNLPATPQLFSYIKMNQTLIELHHYGRYMLVSNICDAVLESFNQGIDMEIGCPEKTETNSDNFVLLSTKDMKELVMQWITYHVNNDENMTPAYFDRIVSSWKSACERQSGMKSY